MDIKSRSSSKLDHMGSKTCSLDLFLRGKYTNIMNRKGLLFLHEQSPEHLYHYLNDDVRLRLLLMKEDMIYVCLYISSVTRTSHFSSLIKYGDSINTLTCIKTRDIDEILSKWSLNYLPRYRWTMIEAVIKQVLEMKVKYDLSSHYTRPRNINE